MKILAIETSCDDTCAAVLENDRLLSSVISSQTDLHAKWGGVVPDIAKRAHAERIEAVIAQALKCLNPPALRAPSLDKEGLKNNKVDFIIEEGMKMIDVIAVTLGPGLAIALGVGVNKAKELAIKYNKKLIGANHVEGHILANLIKNKEGKPERIIEFPALALTVSGGHTKLILIQNPSVDKSTSPLDEREKLNKEIFNFKYTVIGETLDDAAGEALDKAAKMMGLGYPGGPIIERLAEKGDKKYLVLPRPLSGQKNFDYSFSGLKTSFYYQIKDWPKEKIGENLANLSASFQDAVFDSLLIKFKKAVEFYNPKTLLASGGVMANLELRKRLRKMAKEFKTPLLMPVKKQFNTDNAAMIGITAYYKALRDEFVEDKEELDRDPRLNF
jgi:N6-L-threonylcarbamoyladenine synthase